MAAAWLALAFAGALSLVFGFGFPILFVVGLIAAIRGKLTITSGIKIHGRQARTLGWLLVGLWPIASVAAIAIALALASRGAAEQEARDAAILARVLVGALYLFCVAIYGYASTTSRSPLRPELAIDSQEAPPQKDIAA